MSDEAKPAEPKAKPAEPKKVTDEADLNPSLFKRTGYRIWFKRGTKIHPYPSRYILLDGSPGRKALVDAYIAKCKNNSQRQNILAVEKFTTNNQGIASGFVVIAGKLTEGYSQHAKQTNTRLGKAAAATGMIEEYDQLDTK